MKPEAYKRLYRVPEAMAVLSLSRSVIYELIRSGRLRSVTEGRSRLILRRPSLSTSRFSKAKRGSPDGRAAKPGRRRAVLG